MILIDTLLGKTASPLPLWLMRQAGRYLPEYRKRREAFPHFLDLVLCPEAAKDVTLQPIQRFDFDAAILFADILVVPYGLGQKVVFANGIHMDSIDNINAPFDKESFYQKVAPVMETISLTRQDLSKDKALIGFAGGPFTVLCYMLEGGSNHGFPKARSFAFSQRKRFEQWLDIMTEATIFYLEKQIEAGVNVVQLFETWASLVPWPYQHEWIVKPLTKIISALRAQWPDFPVISYLKGVGQLLPCYAQASHTTALSLDTTYDLEDTSSFSCVLQGNLDPQILVEGGDVLEEAVEKIKKYAHKRPFIFNLGHGILPQTPVAHVEQLVRLVKG